MSAILISVLFRVLRRGQVAMVDCQLANRGWQHHHALSIYHKLFGWRFLFIPGGCRLAEITLFCIMRLRTYLSCTAVTIELEKLLCFLSLGRGWLLSVQVKLVVSKLHVLSGRHTWLFESLVSNRIPFLRLTVATWDRLRGFMWLLDCSVDITSVLSQTLFHQLLLNIFARQKTAVLSNVPLAEVFAWLESDQNLISFMSC